MSTGAECDESGDDGERLDLDPRDEVRRGNVRGCFYYGMWDEPDRALQRRQALDVLETIKSLVSVL